VQLLQIKLTDSLFACVRQIAAARGCQNPETYARERLEQDAADLRLELRARKTRPNYLGDRGEAASKRSDNYIHQRPFSPEEIQRIIFLRHSEGVCVRAIAARMRCSTSRIQRALAHFDEHAAHNPSAAQPGPNHKRGEALRIILKTPRSAA
jgi:hypothetical protein